MNRLEASKTVASNAATSSVAGGTVALTIDTKGFGTLSVDAIVTTAVSTSAVLSICTLRAADTVAALADYTSTYGSIAGATSSANTSATQTASASVVRFDFDLRGKPRYISFAIAPNDTNARAILVGRLGRGEVGPDSASEMGALVKFVG